MAEGHPHAADTMKRLGFECLWVDRLCIDQSTRAEKYYLISKVASIYEGAELAKGMICLAWGRRHANRSARFAFSLGACSSLHCRIPELKFRATNGLLVNGYTKKASSRTGNLSLRITGSIGSVEAWPSKKTFTFRFASCARDQAGAYWTSTFVLSLLAILAMTRIR